MPDPAELPVELLNPILDVALQSDTSDTPDTQHLYSLALFNRKWSVAMRYRIYHEWSYNGARHSFMTLWKFVRTVRSNPHIAALVRTLNIGNWGFYPLASQPQSQLQFLPDEIELMRNTIHNAGLNDLEKSIFESLSRRDRRPLIVLLLASVPNLSTLYAHVSGKPLCSLSKLKELYLFPEVPARKTSPSEDTRLYLKLDYLWLVFYLLSLRTLSLFYLDSHKAAEYLKHHATVSHVENLYLIGYSRSEFTHPDTYALLTRAEGLKSLSLYLRESAYGPKVSNSDIWDYLQKYKGRLRTIDIYQDAVIPGDKNGYFSPFHKLPNLVSLGIQAETLLDKGALLHLQEALPPTVQSLTPYANRGGTYVVNPDLPEQIQELLETPFPSLRSITLELEAVAYSDGNLIEPYQQLKEVCAGKGIILRVKNGDQLPKGGSCRGLWAKTFYMKEDGHQQYAAVSYMLKMLRDSKEFLIKLAEEAEDDDDEGTDSEDKKYDPSIYRKSRTLKVYTVPFIDHHNKTAYMIFQNIEKFPLPPLYSFTIYFTHLAATPNIIDFYKQLTDYRLVDEFDVRFDIYFLLLATHEGCISYYSMEKATRGSYLDQVRMFKQRGRDKVHPLPETNPVVPGMVNKYPAANQVLYICSEKDWREGRQTLCELIFDELANADTTPSFRATNRPMTDQSPGYNYHNSAYPAASKMRDMARWDREY